MSTGFYVCLGTKWGMKNILMSPSLFSLFKWMWFFLVCVVFIIFVLMSMCFFFCVFFLWCVLMWTMCACLCVQDRTTRKKSFCITIIVCYSNDPFLCFLVVLFIMYSFFIVVKFYGHFCHLFMVFFWCVKCMLWWALGLFMKRGGCVCKVM
jgi:hypothetical protein